MPIDVEAQPASDAETAAPPREAAGDRSTDHHERPTRPRILRTSLHVAAVLLALALVIGPTIMAGGANQRLESACPVAATKAGSWTYDRSSWLPLLWSCEVMPPGGEVETIRVWDTFG